MIAFLHSLSTSCQWIFDRNDATGIHTSITSNRNLKFQYMPSFCCRIILIFFSLDISISILLLHGLILRFISSRMLNVGFLFFSYHNFVWGLCYKPHLQVSTLNMFSGFHISHVLSPLLLYIENSSKVTSLLIIKLRVFPIFIHHNR